MHRRNIKLILMKSGNGEFYRKLWSYLEVLWKVTMLTANLHDDVPGILQAWTFASLFWHAGSTGIFTVRMRSSCYVLEPCEI
jgi:hypothetical protein